MNESTGKTPRPRAGWCAFFGLWLSRSVIIGILLYGMVITDSLGSSLFGFPHAGLSVVAGLLWAMADVTASGEF